jgi:hypothetical protein
MPRRTFFVNRITDQIELGMSIEGVRQVVAPAGGKDLPMITVARSRERNVDVK